MKENQASCEEHVAPRSPERAAKSVFGGQESVALILNIIVADLLTSTCKGK